MKKPQNVDDLAAVIGTASSAPLVRLVPDAPAQAPKNQKIGSVSVFLRLPSDLHATLEAEAVSRTKATGKGVTVQQVILQKLLGAA